MLHWEMVPDEQWLRKRGARACKYRRSFLPQRRRNDMEGPDLTALAFIGSNGDADWSASIAVAILAGG
jgi:hypothetical protein